MNEHIEAKETLKEHYWDSLETERNIILKHTNAAIEKEKIESSTE